jgi:hypothetical protein
MNYTKDMRIDDSALDVEWADQAELAIKYGKIWAEAHRNLLIAEENVKVIRAELINKVNQNPQKTVKKDKPTDSDKEAYYRTHELHIKAKEELIEAQYQCDMAEVAKNEVSFTRKSALENLVTLFGQNYFAGPSVPRNLHLEREKRNRDRETNSGIAQRLRRKIPNNQ